MVDEDADMVEGAGWGDGEGVVVSAADVVAVLGAGPIT
jgi:hypothetical protein